MIIQIEDSRSNRIGRTGRQGGRYEREGGSSARTYLFFVFSF